MSYILAIFTKENVFLGSLMGLGGYFLGLPWQTLFIWFGLMLMDIITGVISSGIAGTFNSKDLKFGLFRKLIDITVMIAILLIQRFAELNDISIPIGSIMVGAFCFKELASILENYALCGGKLPESVNGWLKVLSDKMNKTEEKGD